MAEERFPIPVEHLSATQAKRLVCEACGTERDATEDEIVSCLEYMEHKGCGGEITWKYAEGNKCPGCGKLGWWTANFSTGACSRVCHLQVEYAAELQTVSGDEGEHDG